MNRLVTEPVRGPLGLAQVLTGRNYVASSAAAGNFRIAFRGTEIASANGMENNRHDGPGADEAQTHDPESTSRQGMSREGALVDDEETMASTGNQESAFQQIASGTATGLGIDRGEEIGTGGLADEADRDDVAEGDYWRQLMRSDPFASPERSAERLDGEHQRLGWQTGADLDPRDQEIAYHNRSEDRERSEPDEEP